MMRGMGPGMNLWDYVMYAAVSSAFYAVVGPRWWLVPLLLAGLFLWPYPVRFFRWALRRAVVGARASGVARAPGVLYCAECGSPLGTGAPAECRACSGKWCLEADLAARAAAKRRPVPDWAADPAFGAPLPCPKCFEPMPAGSFLGASYGAHRCATCGGFWFDRVDWVSFELG